MSFSAAKSNIVWVHICNLKHSYIAFFFYLKKCYENYQRSVLVDTLIAWYVVQQKSYLKNQPKKPPSPPKPTNQTKSKSKEWYYSSIWTTKGKYLSLSLQEWPWGVFPLKGGIFRQRVQNQPQVFYSLKDRNILIQTDLLNRELSWNKFRWCM